MSSRERLLSYHALKKARTTIEDFVQSYFPLHRLSVSEDFFKYWDVLVFVEAAIYEMDEENEVLASQGLINPLKRLKGEQVLTEVLREQGLLSYHISLQLLQGKAYWQRERHLCSRMLSQEQQPAFTLEEVHAASESKSFDYRLLHCVLYSLIGREPDQKLSKFLFLDEHLVDIGDDLHDYEEDVLNNSFNIFRAYVHLFGQEAQLRLVERISEFEDRHRAALCELPKWMQEAYRSRQKQASSVPGSDKWVFPQPIYDERRYRERLAHLDGQ